MEQALQRASDEALGGLYRDFALGSAGPSNMFVHAVIRTHMD